MLIYSHKIDKLLRQLKWYFKLPFFLGTLFFRKLVWKTSKLKTRTIKSLMEEEIALRNKVRGWVELESPDPLKPLPVYWQLPIIPQFYTNLGTVPRVRVVKKQIYLLKRSDWLKLLLRLLKRVLLLWLLKNVNCHIYGSRILLLVHLLPWCLEYINRYICMGFRSSCKACR